MENTDRGAGNKKGEAPERKIEGSGKMEVKYYNIVQPIIGAILVLGGIITTYVLFQDYGLRDPKSYPGLLLVIGGIAVIILWNRTFCLFDKDKNRFESKVKSLFKKNVREHKLTEVKNIVYSENLRMRRSKGRTNRSIERIAEVEMDNGVRYLLHRSTSSSRVGLLKNKTKKKAEEIASFIGVEVKNESFSPGNIAGKVIDKLGGKS